MDFEFIFSKPILGVKWCLNPIVINQLKYLLGGALQLCGFIDPSDMGYLR